jgi:hypothetical protein
MTIYEQLIAVCGNRKGRTLTTAEIRDLVVERFGTKPGSVIPSDYCYNRRNATMGDRWHLFEYLQKGHYKYLGPGHPYSGEIFERPRGTTVDRKCGEWTNGKRELFAGDQ